MELAGGSRHDISLSNPDQYDISTFISTELPIQTGQQEEDSHLSRRDTPIHALGMAELWQRSRGGGDAARPYLIELHYRFAFPTACLVLMLVGVPIGLSSKRGGKGSGFLVTILLVLLYYVLSIMGVALGPQGKVPRWRWGANIIFMFAGVMLIQQLARGGFALNLSPPSVRLSPKSRKPLRISVPPAPRPSVLARTCSACAVHCASAFRSSLMSTSSAASSETSFW